MFLKEMRSVQRQPFLKWFVPLLVLNWTPKRDALQWPHKCFCLVRIIVWYPASCCNQTVYLFFRNWYDDTFAPATCYPLTIPHLSKEWELYLCCELWMTFAPLACPFSSPSPQAMLCRNCCDLKEQIRITLNGEAGCFFTVYCTIKRVVLFGVLKRLWKYNVPTKFAQWTCKLFLAPASGNQPLPLLQGGQQISSCLL